MEDVLWRMSQALVTSELRICDSMLSNPNEVGMNRASRHPRPAKL